MTAKRPAYAVALFSHAIALSLLISSPAFASSADDLDRLVRNGAESHAKVQVMPPQNIEPAAGAPAADTADTTDDTVIRLTPDQTKVVRIEQDAASVIVANPAHANVVLDSPRLLVVMPRMPGTTSLTILDAEGKTIAERTIIVSAMAKPKYMRIRRICSGSDASCQPSAYFYCPDGCYEVMPVQPDNGGGGNAPADVGNNAAPSVADPDLQRPANPNALPGSVAPMPMSNGAPGLSPAEAAPVIAVPK